MTRCLAYSFRSVNYLFCFVTGVLKVDEVAKERPE